MTDPQDETYSDAETEARAAAALKRMLATPHKPRKTGLTPMKAKGVDKRSRRDSKNPDGSSTSRSD